MLSLLFFCIQSINRQPLAAKKWHRSDIIFIIMQHSDCNSFLADMLSPLNNTSMVTSWFFNSMNFLFSSSEKYYSLKAVTEFTLALYLYYRKRKQKLKFENLNANFFLQCSIIFVFTAAAYVLLLMRCESLCDYILIFLQITETSLIVLI